MPTRPVKTSLLFPNAQLQGWLMKQRHGMTKTWLRRYFVLQDHTLRYYKSETDSIPQGCVDLSDYDVQTNISPLNIMRMETPRDHTFCLVSNSLNKTLMPDFFLQAGSEDSMFIWVQSIKPNLDTPTSVLDKWLERLDMNGSTINSTNNARIHPSSITSNNSNIDSNTDSNTAPLRTYALTTVPSDASSKAPSVKAPSVKAPSVKAPSVKAPSVKAPSVKAHPTRSPSVKGPSTKSSVNSLPFEPANRPTLSSTSTPSHIHFVPVTAPAPAPLPKHTSVPTPTHSTASSKPSVGPFTTKIFVHSVPPSNDVENTAYSSTTTTADSIDAGVTTTTTTVVTTTTTTTTTTAPTNNNNNNSRSISIFPTVVASPFVVPTLPKKISNATPFLAPGQLTLHPHRSMDSLNSLASASSIASASTHSSESSSSGNDSTLSPQRRSSEQSTTSVNTANSNLKYTPYKVFTQWSRTSRADVVPQNKVTYHPTVSYTTFSPSKATTNTQSISQSISVEPRSLYSNEYTTVESPIKQSQDNLLESLPSYAPRYYTYPSAVLSHGRSYSVTQIGSR